jgi:hypothetical protein
MLSAELLVRGSMLLSSMLLVQDGMLMLVLSSCIRVPHLQASCCIRDVAVMLCCRVAQQLIHTTWLCQRCKYVAGMAIAVTAGSDVVMDT